MTMRMEVATTMAYHSLETHDPHHPPIRFPDGSNRMSYINLKAKRKTLSPPGSRLHSLSTSRSLQPIVIRFPQTHRLAVSDTRPKPHCIRFRSYIQSRHCVNFYQTRLETRSCTFSRLLRLSIAVFLSGFVERTTIDTFTKMYEIARIQKRASTMCIQPATFLAPHQARISSIPFLSLAPGPSCLFRITLQTETVSPRAVCLYPCVSLSTQTHPVVRVAFAPICIFPLFLYLSLCSSCSLVGLPPPMIATSSTKWFSFLLAKIYPIMWIFVSALHRPLSLTPNVYEEKTPKLEL